MLTILIGLGLSSCSVGRYVNPSQNLNLNQTQVVLSDANFRVVKHVTTSVIYTQSAMRFDSDQLYQSAYAELLREANLTGSQALINVTVELVERTSGIWFKRTDCAIVASGIVIEFINPNVQQQDVISGGSISTASPTSPAKASAERKTLSQKTPVNEKLKDLLNSQKEVTFIVNGNANSSRIKRYQSEFQRTFNASSKKLQLSSDSKPVKLQVTIGEITDYGQSKMRLRATFINSKGAKEVINLGTDNIQTLAKKLANIVDASLI